MIIYYIDKHHTYMSVRGVHKVNVLHMHVYVCMYVCMYMSGRGVHKVNVSHMHVCVCMYVCDIRIYVWQGSAQSQRVAYAP
jgi:hypothetical protein